VTVREQAQLLGPRRSLVGVSTEPAQGAAPGRPMVVLLNSGIVHRVGANRMSVPLARALAETGHAVLRFDLSGIGDSPPRGDALTPLEGSLADLREVLDTLEKSRGVRRVVLGGLCSGADHSIAYARSDPRVVGAFLLDPTIPPTRLGRLHHYRKRMLSGESWLNVVKGRNPFLRQVVARVAGAPGQAPGNAAFLSSPEVKEFLTRAYGGAVAAGVRLLAVLTSERATYRRQLLDALPEVDFGDLLELEYFEESDHMFSLEADRRRVIELVVRWVAEGRFVERGTAPGTASGGQASGSQA
jgi:pimeloyl-ACP methyl ester carboxylesterase